MKVSSGKYKKYYITLSVIYIGQIANIWISFINKYDANILGVYSGLVTACILCMKKLKSGKMYNISRILANIIIMLMPILVCFSLINGPVFNGKVYDIIRSVGFGATLGTFFIQWNIE